jgi:hypothetical protein
MSTRRRRTTSIFRTRVVSVNNDSAAARNLRRDLLHVHREPVRVLPHHELLIVLHRNNTEEPSDDGVTERARREPIHFVIASHTNHQKTINYKPLTTNKPPATTNK